MEIPLSPEREAQLDAVARRQGKAPSAVAAEALADYLDHAQWLAEGVSEGIQAAERGELLEHEEVIRMIEQRYS